MSPGILLAIDIALAVSNNLILHTMRGKRGLNTGDSLQFNAFVTLIWVVILAFVTGLGGFSLPVLGWGLCYGGFYTVFLLSKMQAMAQGPASVTTFISCASLIVPCFFGFLALNETVSVLQWIGIALLLFSMYLTVSPRNDGSMTPKWKYWCAVFFLVSGIIGSMLKLIRSSPEKESMNQIMFCGAVLSTVCYFAAARLVSRKQAGRGPEIPRFAILPMLLCGVITCSYQWINFHLSGRLPASVLFPIFNGSLILIVTAVSVPFFHEKLDRKQIIGLVLGLPALIMVAGILG